MELAIPLLALGGMYVISNQSSRESSNQNNYNDKTNVINNKNNKNSNDASIRENFETAGRQRNYLPNTDIPPQNYPVTNRKELVNTVQEYVNPNTATDRYFNQNAYENRVNAGKSVGHNPQQI